MLLPSLLLPLALAGEPPAPKARTVRFVALGDTGEGNPAQYKVARAIAQVCKERGCDFVVLLGDNFYSTGVSSVYDPQWVSAFEAPYAEIKLPFYAVLGNHDYGGNGAGFEWWKAGVEVAYGDHSAKWIMPDKYYSFSTSVADFFALDTNAILWGVGEDQLPWLQDAEAKGHATWRIAFGHHPYISNGPHGNAGDYEGQGWIPVMNGSSLKDFIEAGVCDKVDVYISGHDHDQQWLEPTCGTEFIVSGGGSKTTTLEDRDHDPTFFEKDATGFLWVELTDTTFTGVFYDSDANQEFSRELTKHAWPNP